MPRREDGRAHAQMEQRHPADWRLAARAQRFEAYHRIWTPVYALASDLQQRSGPTEKSRPNPRAAGPRGEQKALHHPVVQGCGHAGDELYDPRNTMLELRRFLTEHAGLCLLSDAEVEVESGARDLPRRLVTIR